MRSTVQGTSVIAKYLPFHFLVCSLQMLSDEKGCVDHRLYTRLFATRIRKREEVKRSAGEVTPAKVWRRGHFFCFVSCSCLSIFNMKGSNTPISKVHFERPLENAEGLARLCLFFLIITVNSVNNVVTVYETQRRFSYSHVIDVSKTSFFFIAPFP